MRSFAILVALASYVAASFAHPLYGPRPKPPPKPPAEDERSQNVLDLSSLDFPGGVVAAGGNAASVDDLLKESKRWGKGKRSIGLETSEKQQKRRSGRRHRSTTTSTP